MMFKVLRDYDAAFLYHLALLTRSQCKVSDTQVTAKVCGPLVCLIRSKQICKEMNKTKYDKHTIITHGIPKVMFASVVYR